MIPVQQLCNKSPEGISEYSWYINPMMQFVLSTINHSFLSFSIFQGEYPIFPLVSTYINQISHQPIQPAYDRNDPSDLRFDGTRFLSFPSHAKQNVLTLRGEKHNRSFTGYAQVLEVRFMAVSIVLIGVQSVVSPTSFDFPPLKRWIGPKSWTWRPSYRGGPGSTKPPLSKTCPGTAFRNLLCGS